MHKAFFFPIFFWGCPGPATRSIPARGGPWSLCFGARSEYPPLSASRRTPAASLGPSPTGGGIGLSPLVGGEPPPQRSPGRFPRGSEVGIYFLGEIDPKGNQGVIIF